MHNGPKVSVPSQKNIKHSTQSYIIQVFKTGIMSEGHGQAIIGSNENISTLKLELLITIAFRPHSTHNIHIARGGILRHSWKEKLQKKKIPGSDKTLALLNWSTYLQLPFFFTVLTMSTLPEEAI